MSKRITEQTRSLSLFAALLLLGFANICHAAVPATRFDFDGDRKADVSVFRNSDANWYISKSSGGHNILRFGLDGDEPVPADYDGDGKFDIAVYRGGVWYQLLSGTNSVLAYAFGLPSDLPVPADFDGDSKADLAVFRPSNGVWHVVRSSNQSYFSFAFGINEDLPLVAD